jgi:integrase
VGRKVISLEAINERLRWAKLGVTVRQKGNRLYLRATLPPKPNSAHKKPHQQDLALGIYANPVGLERAEAEAHKLGAKLACREFEWGSYLSNDEQAAVELTVEQWVAQFKQHYMATHSLTERTWIKHWWEVYKRLPQEKPLAVSGLMEVVQQTEPDTRNRKQTCEKLQKLADFAALEVDLMQYSGNYSSTKAQPRDVPSDALIAEWRDRFPVPEWRWVYGVVAAYGLRPHEAFFCEFIDGDANCALQVLEGKTGPRKVLPLYLEWVERWELWKVCKPRIQAGNYETYGARACRQFNRYGVPFTPYALRHAYAIRASIVFKFPVAVAAALMGHSPTVHWNLYNRWISEDLHIQEFERQVKRPDRPQALDVELVAWQFCLWFPAIADFVPNPQKP